MEIPRGSRNKYEYDPAAGIFRLDRVLSSAVFYNFDYGFVPETLAGDGDPTDTLLLIDEPTFTGCHVWARPVGALESWRWIVSGRRSRGPYAGAPRPSSSVGRATVL